MGNYWSTVETGGFSDFRIKYQPSDDLKDFFEVDTGIRPETISRTAVTRAIMRWVQEYNLFDEATQCVRCDPVLAHLFKVKHQTLTSYDQMQGAIDNHLTHL